MWESIKEVMPWILLGWALFGGFFGLLYWLRYGKKEVERIEGELGRNPEKYDETVREKMYARVDNAVLEPLPSIVFGAVGGPLSAAIYFSHP